MNEIPDDKLNLKCWEIADSCLLSSLRLVTRAVTKIYDDAMRPLGLRGTQFNLLAATFLMGPVPISKLAEVLVMDRTTLTRNLSLLEKQGMIDISPGKDQRTRAATVTDSGKHVLKEAIPLWEKAQQQVTVKLGKNRTKSMLADLKTAARYIV
ncbi:MAG TPA: MarR family transcriptional regulator [Desulfobulbus sp.]|nr:MarR family transcriptional regulator [Desulfobulbus sp.]